MIKDRHISYKWLAALFVAALLVAFVAAQPVTAKAEEGNLVPEDNSDADDGNSTMVYFIKKLVVFCDDPKSKAQYFNPEGNIISANQKGISNDQNFMKIFAIVGEGESRLWFENYRITMTYDNQSVMPNHDDYMLVPNHYGITKGTITIDISETSHNVFSEQIWPPVGCDEYEIYFSPNMEVYFLGQTYQDPNGNFSVKGDDLGRAWVESVKVPQMVTDGIVEIRIGFKNPGNLYYDQIELDFDDAMPQIGSNQDATEVFAGIDSVTVGTDIEDADISEHQTVRDNRYTEDDSYDPTQKARVFWKRTFQNNDESYTDPITGETYQLTNSFFIDGTIGIRLCNGLSRKNKKN